MTLMRLGLGAAASLMAAALTAHVLDAQAMGVRKLEISFNNGLVTILAENVTVREILQEWARKGGSRLVNAEKMGGAAVPMIEFRSQPEAAVLRSLLREVPGYGAAPRIAPSADSSTIATLFILPTRTVPVATGSSPMLQQPVQSVQPPPQQPQLGPRAIQGSVDAEIPPARQVGELPPSTPGSPTATDPNLKTGPGGTVTSTIPGVIIPGPTEPAKPGGTPTGPGATGPRQPPGRGGGGGGR